jgi:glyceraldehyde 3-phosphate dehydrogenase
MDKKVKVAINGFGRIGRAFFKLAISRPEIELVAINDLGDPDNLGYLLKYDSVYGRSEFDVDIVKDKKDVYLLINRDRKLKVFSEKDPKKLPWKELGVDVVVESTGAFRKYEDARAHIKAGAKKVVISAPAQSDPKDEKEATILIGVNEEKFKTCEVSSNASCTTNSAGVLVKVLDEGIGVDKALLNTVHAYTSTQGLVDSPNKDFRRGRAADLNIVPSSTGAAEATGLAIPALQGKFDGVALRVPVTVGSIADITFIAKRNTTVDEVNQILKRAAVSDQYRGILQVTEEEIVSQDIVGNPHASVVDSKMTRVSGGNLVKVLAWYDNEIGYANTLVQHVIKSGSSLELEPVKKITKKAVKKVVKKLAVTKKK